MMCISDMSRFTHHMLPLYACQVSKAPPGPVDVGPLSMALNGTIDAAVNGGTQKYIEAFLTAEFAQAAEATGDAATLEEVKQVTCCEDVTFGYF
jgi:hypothetical protein